MKPVILKPNIVFFNTRRKKYHNEHKYVYLLKNWIWWNMIMRYPITWSDMSEYYNKNYDYTRHLTRP